MNSETPRRRADARRNRELLLAAAHRLFLERGAGVRTDEIVAESGVGKGTFYRHFPTREHLLVAVGEASWEELAATGLRLLNESDPRAAFREWLIAFDRHTHAYRDFSSGLRAVFADRQSEIAEACAPMRRSGGTLLSNAQRAGVVRSDLTFEDIMMLISSLPDGPRDDTGSSIFLPTILRGLEAE